MNREATSSSAAEQDYLKQIYLLQQDTGRATTQMLAERLGVKPPSVTAMVKRLAEDPAGPLVRHTPYRAVELTERGLAVALEMLRHHRLIELFLTDELGMTWDEVHEEADRLEHVFSENLEDRISAKLGDPTIDPHGDPIPTREGTVLERHLTRLTELECGKRGRIARLEEQDPAVLQYLAALGLTLGTGVTLESVAPFGGVVTIRLDGEGISSFPLGGELAESILLTADPSEEPKKRRRSG